MPLIDPATVPHQPFRGGATYQTLVGDESGSTPVFIGLQTAPPGYRTAQHSHPYMEVIIVIDGEGEAWTEDDGRTVALKPGMTLVLPAGVRHWFGTTGDKPLRIYGVHANPQRVVHVHEEAPASVASRLG